ncbi:MAG: TSUP family transporter [Myxococcales bacterium]|nr:TSUP family transporter [Myxococcales bacterium]MBK7197092.1 TSUP family transporter [Myxococcales bacterium]MBP6843226.1 TSUP family transporter [Kofleriaceae bacterium]
MDLGLATTAALTAVAAVAGCVDAIAGGGGLLTLPALLTAGVPAPLALGTNKGQSVFGSGAATLRFARAGKLTWRRSLPSFAAGFAGSLAGAAAVSQLDTAALKPLIIVLLCVAAVLVLVPRPTTARTPARPLLTATAIALVVGGYDGFFGPGTGTLLIVGYLWLLGEAADAASANAKVVNFASNLAAVAWFGAHGAIVWAVSLPMAAGQFVGALVGAHVVLTRGGGVVRLAAVAVALALVAKLSWGLIG